MQVLHIKTDLLTRDLFTMTGKYTDVGPTIGIRQVMNAANIILVPTGKCEVSTALLLSVYYTEEII